MTDEKPVRNFPPILDYFLTPVLEVAAWLGLHKLRMRRDAYEHNRRMVEAKALEKWKTEDDEADYTND